MAQWQSIFAQHISDNAFHYHQQSLNFSNSAEIYDLEAILLTHQEQCPILERVSALKSFLGDVCAPF